MSKLIQAAAAAAVILLGATAVSAQMQSKQDKEVTGKPTNEDAAKNNSAATGSGSGQAGTSTKEETPTDPNEKKGPLVKQIEKEGKKSP